MTLDSLRRLVDAVKDMRSGWRYIRERHGDLDGVGWNRCEMDVTAALAAVRVDAIERLYALAPKALEYLETWACSDECDCEPEGHICGQPELLQFIDQLRSALSALQKDGEGKA